MGDTHSHTVTEETNKKIKQFFDKFFHDISDYREKLRIFREENVRYQIERRSQNIDVQMIDFFFGETESKMPELPVLHLPSPSFDDTEENLKEKLKSFFWIIFKCHIKNDGYDTAVSGVQYDNLIIFIKEKCENECITYRHFLSHMERNESEKRRCRKVHMRNFIYDKMALFFNDCLSI